MERDSFLRVKQKNPSDSSCETQDSLLAAQSPAVLHENRPTNGLTISELVGYLQKNLPSLRRLVALERGIDSLTLNREGITRIQLAFDRLESLLTEVQSLAPHDILDKDHAALALHEFRALCKKGLMRHCVEYQGAKGSRIDFTLALQWSGGVQWEIRVVSTASVEESGLREKTNQHRFLNDCATAQFRLQKRRTFTTRLPLWGSIFVRRLTDPTLLPYGATE